MITREILEHYLRATGWVQVAEEEHLYWRRAGSHSLQVLGDPDAMVALVERRAVPDVRICLGACIGAERLFQQAAAVKASASRVLRDCRSIDFEVAVTKGNARELLGLAGIEFDQWEAARCP